jgi:hypothetical protein
VGIKYLKRGEVERKEVGVGLNRFFTHEVHRNV